MIQKKTLVIYGIVSYFILIISFVLAGLYFSNLKSEKLQNENLGGNLVSTRNSISPSPRLDTTKDCVFTGTMQKLAYAKLSNIINKSYCDSKYQSWTKIKNDPISFQALIPSYYRHNPDYGGLGFTISHPVYGNFTLGDWGGDGNADTKLRGWSNIEKFLCVGADLGHIPNSISAFEYFTDDTRSGNYYMAKQDGRGVVVMNPYSGNYWGITVIYQSKPEDTQGSSSFKEKSLLRDPEFLCFLGSIDLVSSATKNY